MAYKGEKSKSSILLARNLNKSKRPDGFIYILKLKGFDLYKIGVSANPKRRIYDIDSNSPFGVKEICVLFFKNVYEIEECVHDNFKSSLKRKEWFEMSEQCIKSLQFELKEMSESGLYLIRR